MFALITKEVHMKRHLFTLAIVLALGCATTIEAKTISFKHISTKTGISFSNDTYSLHIYQSNPTIPCIHCGIDLYLDSNLRFDWAYPQRKHHTLLCRHCGHRARYAITPIVHCPPPPKKPHRQIHKTKPKPIKKAPPQRPRPHKKRNPRK